MSHPVGLKSAAIIGVGLIGGSVARALKKSELVDEVIGCDSNRAMLQWAQGDGVIDRIADSPEEAAERADLVVLCVPVGATESVFSKLRKIRQLPVMTDVGSSKASVLSAVNQVFGEVPSCFVPGHPIAGKEHSGVKASTADLFEDHRVILTPISTTDENALQIVTNMWQAFGAEVKKLSPEQHDLVMGATSHLPHVLAYAAVNTIAKLDFVDEIFEFAAGGFRDFTRIASSDPTMWRDICLANGPAILQMLDHFEDELKLMRTAIEEQRDSSLFNSFLHSKQLRDEFIEKYERK